MAPNWLQYGMFWATLAVGVVTLGATLINYFLFRAHVDPHIVVYCKNDDGGSSLLLIVIENVGSGVAYNVKFKLSRPIPRRAFRIERTGQREFDSIREIAAVIAKPSREAAAVRRIQESEQRAILGDADATNASEI